MLTAARRRHKGPRGALAQPQQHTAQPQAQAAGRHLPQQGQGHRQQHSQQHARTRVDLPDEGIPDKRLFEHRITLRPAPGKVQSDAHQAHDPAQPAHDVPQGGLCFITGSKGPAQRGQMPVQAASTIVSTSLRPKPGPSVVPTGSVVCPAPGDSGLPSAVPGAAAAVPGRRPENSAASMCHSF